MNWASTTQLTCIRNFHKDFGWENQRISPNNDRISPNNDNVAYPCVNLWQCKSHIRGTSATEIIESTSDFCPGNTPNTPKTPHTRQPVYMTAGYNFVGSQNPELVLTTDSSLVYRIFLRTYNF